MKRRKIRPAIYLTDEELQKLALLGGTVSEGIFKLLQEGGIVDGKEVNAKNENTNN